MTVSVIVIHAGIPEVISMMANATDIIANTQIAISYIVFFIFTPRENASALCSSK